MKKLIAVFVVLFFIGINLSAIDELVGIYDSMAGGGTAINESGEYINLFLSQRGTLFKIPAKNVNSGQDIEIENELLKADGKLYCWAAMTALQSDDKTLMFASANDNKLCFTKDILGEKPNLKIISEVYDSASRPIRIEQIAAVNYNNKIYLFVMSADHEIYQSIFDVNKNEKIVFSLLKINDKIIYATSLNAVINAMNSPYVYIKEAGQDKSGTIMKYNFISKTGEVIEDINGSRILVVNDNGNDIIYYGAGLTIKNTFNNDITYSVNSGLGSYIPVITAFYTENIYNVAIATDYSNVIVLNKDLKEVKSFSLTQKKHSL